MFGVRDFEYRQFSQEGFSGQAKGGVNTVYCVLERSETISVNGFIHSTQRTAVISYNGMYGHLLDRIVGSSDPAVVIKSRSLSYEEALEEWNRISTFPQVGNSVVWRETYNFQQQFEQLVV